MNNQLFPHRKPTAQPKRITVSTDYRFIYMAVYFLFLFLALHSLTPAQGIRKEVAPEGKPFSSIRKALNSANSGDSIVIFPGTYHERLVLKNRVNLFFMSGARVVVNGTLDTSQSEIGAFVVSDSGKALECTIRGQGVFILEGVSNNTLGSVTVWIKKDSSRIFLEADSIVNTMSKGINTLASAIVNQGSLTARVKFLSSRLWSGITVAVENDNTSKYGANLDYTGDEIYMDTTETTHQLSAVDIQAFATGSTRVLVRKILAGKFGITYTRGGTHYAEIDEIYAKGMCAFNAMYYGTGTMKVRKMVLLPSNFSNSPVFTNYPAGNRKGNNSLFTLECKYILNMQNGSGESNHYAVKVNGGRLTVISDSIYSNRVVSPVQDSANAHILFVGADTLNGSHPDTTSLTVIGAHIKYNNATRAPVYLGRASLKLVNCTLPTLAQYSVVSDKELIYPNQVQVEFINTRSNAPVLPTISRVLGNITLYPLPPVLFAPDTGTELSEARIRFVWFAPRFANRYKLQVFSDSSASQVVFEDSSLTDTSYLFTASLFNRYYYWKVTAFAGNEPSDAGPLYSFYLKMPAPAVPNLLTPSDRSIMLGKKITLRWSKERIVSITAYSLQIAEDSLFTLNTTLIGGITDTVYQWNNAAAGKTYFWRVDAENAGGTRGFTAPFSFSTRNLLSAPKIISPPNGAVSVYPEPLFIRWVKTDSSALPEDTLYRFRIYTDTASIALFDTLMAIDSLSFQPKVSTRYFCQVAHSNEFGQGPFSPFAQFTTSRFKPSIQIPIEPILHQKNIFNPVVFSWRTDPLSNAYRFLLYHDSTLITDTLISDTIWVINTVLPGKNYYWQIAGVNEVGLGSLTEKLHFSTLPLPQQPDPVFPSDSSYSVRTDSIRFVWSGNGNNFARHFVVYILKGTDTLYRSANTSDTSIVSVISLLKGTQYRWMVRAFNPFGGSLFSAQYTFITVNNPPPPAVHYFPLHNSKGIADSCRIVFSKPFRSDSLTVWLSLNDTLSFIPVYSGSDTSILLSGLTPDSRYYRKITAYNDGGSSVSETFSFYTFAFPEQVVLLSPDSSVAQRLPVQFLWRKPRENALERGLTYRFMVFSDTALTQSLIDTVVADTSYSVSSTLQPGTVYFWKVQGINELGSGQASVIRKLRIISAPPPAPVLISPENGNLFMVSPVVLQWNAPEAEKSIVSVRRLNDSSIVINDTIAASGPYNFLLGLPGESYLWNCQSLNEGGISPISETRSFSMYPIAAPPQLLLPINAGTKLPTNPITFVWNRSVLPPVYSVQYLLVLYNDTALAPIFSSDLLSDTTLILTNLLLNNNTRYFWRVRAVTPAGNGSYSQFYSFKTIALPPPAPSLLSVAVRSRSSIQLQWKDNAVNEMNYLVYRKFGDTSSTAAFEMIASLPAESELFTDSTVIENTRYTWQIVALGQDSLISTSNSISIIVIVSVVNHQSTIPGEYSLSQNYPNPFNPVTRIGYAIKETGKVVITLTSISGEPVATLVEAIQPAGYYSLPFNASAYSSGVYIVRMSAGGKIFTKKILLLK